MGSAVPLRTGYDGETVNAGTKLHQLAGVKMHHL